MSGVRQVVTAWCGLVAALFVDDYVIEFPIGCSAAESDIDVIRVVWRSRNRRTAQSARFPVAGRQVSTEW